MTPFGLGTPAPTGDPPDGASGTRYLNPATRDYQVDTATGQLAQMPSIRQRVLIALLTVRGSATAAPAFGIVPPRKMGDQFTAEMQQAVRSALKQLTDVEKVVRIDGILVERGAGSRSKTTVIFTDLTTGEGDSASI
jgi:hypothetical protein